MEASISAPGSMPHITPAKLFLWDLCATYAKEFPDPKQPIRSELVRAFVLRIVRLFAIFLYTGDTLNDARLTSEVKCMAADKIKRDLQDLVSQLVELDSWLHKPGSDEMACGNWLTFHGYSFEEACNLIEGSKKYQAGRPPAKRKITVAALDARIDGTRSWSNLAKEFCDCGKSKHDDLCSEALRKSAAHLESTLKKYREIPIPADEFAQLSRGLLDQLGFEHSS
jgi:hypothetical protein